MQLKQFYLIIQILNSTDQKKTTDTKPAATSSTTTSTSPNPTSSTTTNTTTPTTKPMPTSSTTITTQPATKPTAAVTTAAPTQTTPKPAATTTTTQTTPKPATTTTTTQTAPKPAATTTTTTQTTPKPATTTTPNTVAPKEAPKPAVNSDAKPATPKPAEPEKPVVKPENTPPKTMKELIKLQKESLKVDKDSIQIFPQIISPMQRTSSSKTFSNLTFGTAPCGNSKGLKFDSSLITLDQSKTLKFAYYIQGSFQLTYNFKSTNKNITFKTPRYPKLKCRLKLQSGGEQATDQYYLTTDYFVKVASDNTIPLDELDTLSYFDCTGAIKNTAIMRVEVPEVECSPCTLSLEVREPISAKSFQNCADISLVDPASINSNTCVNKCQNRGICMNNRCHCEFFQRGQQCESQIGSATFRAVFFMLFQVFMVALIALVVWKWRELMCVVPQWIRNLRAVGQSRPEGQDQLNEDD